MQNDFHCRIMLLCFIASIISINGQAQGVQQKGHAVTFKKHVVSSVFVSEGAATGDVNKDGRIDILAGQYWYEAPSWSRHTIHNDTLNAPKGYSTSFLNFCMDVNNDGWVDLIKFDVPGGECAWYENPKRENTLWKRRLILTSAGIETPLLTDVDGDGRKDIICNDAEQKQVIWLKSPTGKGDTAWQRYLISSHPDRATHRYTHGVGWADINLDGRKDVIVRTGWWEGPADVKHSEWTWHPANLGDDCANMFALDVDLDGDMDIMSSSAHDYGIWWHEQQKNRQGESTWIIHDISKSFSQSHSMAMADINGDGKPDLITGKRFGAHNEKDPGAAEPAVLYWFECLPGKTPRWVPHEIDNNSGIGNSFEVTDINKDGLLDIITSNKKGVYFFEQVKQ